MPKQPKVSAPLTKVPTTLQSRLFWPLIILLVVGPVVAWEIAQEKPRSATTKEQVYRSKPGPWGELETVRIDIELPDHFVNTEAAAGTDWFFDGATRVEVEDFFRSCQLPDAQLRALIEKTEWKIEADGCHVEPTDELLWNLTPEVRSKIYARLARNPANVDQFYAFTYRPDRLERRLENSGLTDSTTALFKQLLYPQGSLLRFADTDLLMRKLGGAEERKRLVKTVSRRSSLLVKLRIKPETDIDSVVSYWGHGGRAKDLRPFIESLGRVSGGCNIDIAHLLPPFARQRIYTYPNPSQPTQEFMQDCHWTSLNFFSDEPNPSYSGPEQVQRVIAQEYFSVGSDLKKARFGDVIFLMNREGMMVHSAVYIADDIVFTKNGSGINQPWIYMTVEDMLPYYIAPNDTIEVVVYRKKQV